jgi:predicted esterase
MIERARINGYNFPDPQRGSLFEQIIHERMERTLRVVLLVVFSAMIYIACISNAIAQSPELRYQLGRRLTRFESEWQSADPASRVRSTPKMLSAVSSFFSLRLDEAIVKLDEAWLAVQSDTADVSAERISDAGWFVSVRPLLLDREARSVSLSLLHQPLSAALPTSRTSFDLSVAILDTHGQQICERRWTSVANADQWNWELDTLPQGDYQVKAFLHRESEKTEVIANRFSVITDLEKKIEEVHRQASTRPAMGDTKSVTVQLIAKMIQGGGKGRIAESDLPFEALLSDLEYLAVENNTVRELIASRPERSIWLQLGNGKSKQHIRLQTAEKPAGAPLVVAYHGAGGSENMFFESYGAGALIEQCRKNGWSVVSPRQSLTGLGMDLDLMLDELHSHLDFDTERVFLIGHSMGAAQAISQVSKYPSRVRGVAAIGGGGRPTKSDELTKIPFFVAAGEKDFGLPQAKLLSKTLQSFGVNVDFREVKDVEHMVIVQATLDDAMAFFQKLD